MFDLILENGTVVDGTGTPGRRQDVGISGECIAALGDLRGAQAARRVDVGGRIVAPGFIDVHTHHNDEMDGGIENIPSADNYLRQGVTTCVGGNCGGTAFPIGPHLERVSRLQIRSNYAALDQGRGIILAPLEPHPEFQGKTLAEYLAGEPGDPFEATVALCASGHISAIYLAMCEEDVVAYMRSPHVMAGSDGHLRVFGKGCSHPRNFGTFPRILARYVRELGVLPLEEAVRKMTSLPARRLGLRQRGVLEPGRIADVTVFDPERIQDHATFTEGNAYATGIDLVLLAGRIALEHDVTAACGYGRVIRRGEG
ncbi:MAG: amidohydrolase family protein [Candidatus Latescibacterota bacterium]